MNIGIDLDGVVYDTENMFRAWSQIFDLKHEKIGMTKPEEIKAQKRYKWTNDNIKAFLEVSVKKVVETAQIMPFAKEVLCAIAKVNDIYFITRRSGVEIDITKKRLKKDGIPYKTIKFCVTDKSKECEKENIDIMIEDRPEEIKKLTKKGIKCFYYFDTVKRSLKDKNVTEVRNWGDIAVELEKLGIIDSNDIK